MSNKVIGEMTFWDHLSELISRFRRVFYAFIISVIFVSVVPISIDPTNIGLSNPFYQTITSTIINDLQVRFLSEEVNLIPISFFAPLEIYIFISIIIGAAFTLPVASYELYRFFSPALYENEKRFALKFIASFTVLFILGLFFAYQYVVPLTFRTMLMFSSLLSLTPTYEFTEFFSMAGMIILICSLLFTFPIYIYLLVRAGILKTQYLTKNRRYIYGGFLIIIAIVDPDPGLVTEALMFFPIIILMEISIFVSKRVEKSRHLA